VQQLSPFASSGRTADIMPVRARFRTVESKHVHHNTHACTCSMAKNIDILLAHALSHQECQSDVGFARLAPQRVVSPHAWAIWGKRSSRPKFRRPPHHHQTVLSRPRTAKISPYSLKKSPELTLRPASLMRIGAREVGQFELWGTFRRIQRGVEFSLGPGT